MMVRESLSVIGEIVTIEAKDSIGHTHSLYPYRWEELAPSTIADKKRLGFDASLGYEPLKRSGGLQDSIGYTVEYPKVTVGSNDRVAYYHEFGTKNMPARSIFARAVVYSQVRISIYLREAVSSHLTGVAVSDAVISRLKRPGT